MDGSDLASEFIVNTRWKTLSDPVRDKIRMCLMDDLGATLAGTTTRVSRICTDYAVQTWKGNAATILLKGIQAAPIGAAFANGAAANGIDIDDGAQYAYGHAGAQIFPTALALAEDRELDGSRMMAAMVAGYEVAHRVGRCWHDCHEIYQACGSWGSVACAAVAANLIDLSPDKTKHALGIAEYHAPNLPMMRDIDSPAMVKHGIAWATITGITAAELAGAGFTGIQSILGFDKYQDWLSDIGQTYIMVDGVAWKRKGYACCGWAHAAVEGSVHLVQKHNIRIEDIEHIRVEAFHETARLGTKLPTTTEEAQFNLAWPVAAMLIDGEIGPRQTLEERLKDPKIQELARKVEVVESEELNALCRLAEKGDPRGRFASIVSITLENGTTHNSGLVEGSLRFPQPPWRRETMEEKFRWMAEFVLDKARIDKLVDMIWDFENISNVRELTAMLA